VIYSRFVIYATHSDARDKKAALVTWSLLDSFTILLVLVKSEES